MAPRSGITAGDTLLAVDAMNDPRAYMVGKRLIEAGKSPAPTGDCRNPRSEGAAEGMRIIGGSRRGLHLADVGAGDAAAHLRPTSDRVREAIFNLLINGGYGDPVSGARVLDLFAGTGALGLEALSRGAARVAFVDDGNEGPRPSARQYRKDAGHGRYRCLAPRCHETGPEPRHRL